MHSINNSGAPSAPSPKTLQTARVEAVGVSPWLALALADIAFPMTRRDDLAALAAVTANRCSTAGAGVR